MATTTKTFRENVLRIIAVLGLIAVLLLGAWGIIQLAFIIPDFFSGWGSTSKKETLSLSVPAAVVSGAPFPVSWTHKNGSGEYSYSLRYSCAQGVTLKAPLPTGAAQEVACNTPFNYINATTSTPVILALSGSNPASVTFSVTATKLSSGSVTATASSTTTVSPNKTTVPTTTTTPVSKKPAAATAKKSTTSTSYVSSGRKSNLYGYADLAVRITSNPGVVRMGQQVNLKFVVENVGTNVSPANWTFSADLPYQPTYTFVSAPQPSLYPGDKIVYTLGYTAVAPQQYPYGTNPYDPVYGGWSYPYSAMPDVAYPYGGSPYQYGYYPQGGMTQSVSVSVDPMGYIYELTKQNNFASISYQVY